MPNELKFQQRKYQSMDSNLSFSINISVIKLGESELFQYGESVRLTTIWRMRVSVDIEGSSCREGGCETTESLTVGDVTESPLWVPAH